MRFIKYFMFLSVMALFSCNQKQQMATADHSAQSPATTNLRQKIDAGAMLVDVRTPEEFAQGSVPGAVNIPVDQISSNLDKFRGKKDIIVFCRSGNRSGKAKDILESNGFNNVTNGGGWEEVKRQAE